jgi:hypothetical protein
MDKYPLIGVSIIAVVLLVLGSLTNVVGYQSVKSSVVNDSPLFSVRTQKAINQQQNIITSQYLGKGKENLLQFPIRDNKTELVIKTIEFISKMDDKTFAQFTELCIQQARQDNTFSDTNPNEIAQTLHQLKIKSETIINSYISRNNYNITSSTYYTICHWFPGCILAIILYNLPDVIMLLVFFVFMVILNITSRFSVVFTCQQSICGGTRCSKM